MARRSAYRWRDWRVSESGTTIKSKGHKKKRKKKRARGGSGRSNGASVYWWTLAGCDCNCDGCGCAIKAGEKIAYRHEKRRTVCPDCANLTQLKPRMSKRLREASGSVPEPKSKAPAPRKRSTGGGHLQPGQLHPAWPEWTWDGEKFVKTEKFTAAAA
ncbi:MAG TPA: hypothetical protein VF009_07025 [Solirubrobacterales bacterium]